MRIYDFFIFFLFPSTFCEPDTVISFSSREGILFCRINLKEKQDMQEQTVLSAKVPLMYSMGNSIVNGM